MSYRSTFITVADDCPTDRGTVPLIDAERPSVARLQHELLSRAPYRHTDQELIFIVHVTRLGLGQEELKLRGKEIHDELFSKPYPCLRASPLPKRFGWGVHYDENGRLAIVGRETAEYAALSSGTGRAKTVVKAMRNKRAQ